MKFHNRTRTSESIHKKLIDNKQWHLLPIYHLAKLSFLGEEAINNSGSSRFAEHVYGAKPKGKWGIGYLLDYVFLNLPSARSMRNRYLHAKEELQKAIHSRTDQESIHVLALPSGFARELFELDQHFQENDQNLHSRIHWHGLDLDENLVTHLTSLAHERMHFLHGDAFDTTIHTHSYDAIVSLGFGEFINDEQLISFYKHTHKHLKPNGLFITSGMKKHALSDYLMRNLAELYTNYRDADHLTQLHQQAGFTQVTTYTDNVGLQTMVISVKS